MTLRELLLLGVLGWSALGVVGVTMSLRLGQRGQARRNALWLVGVWVAYGAVLGGSSLLGRQRVVAMGADQCFGQTCFAVLRAEALPVTAGDTGGGVLRVSVRVTNRGHGAEAERRMRVYLVDAQGRRWEPLPGLSGNPLTGRVAAGAVMVSEPVFRVARDSSGLRLVFTRGFWQMGTLVIGDSDSLGHRRTVVELGR
jgi:hypothetical protein